MSRRYLDVVAGAARQPVALVGGWGVYFTVTSAYVAEFGRDYAFSRDIDLGFHLDPAWSAEQVRASSLGRTVRALERAHFESVSFRLLRQFRREGLSPLTPEEARALPLFDIVGLYVDPLVDYPHPLCKDAVGFAPVHDPMLAPLFAKPLPQGLPRVGGKLVVPPREVLLRMKLRSIHMRGEGHKAQKDAADTFALVVTSPGGAREIVDSLGDRDLGRRFVDRVGQFDPADWAALEAGTGAPRSRIRTTLAALAAEPREASVGKGAARSRAAELRRRGVELLSRYAEARSAHRDTRFAGDFGAVLGGELARAAGLRQRTGKKWGRRIATARPRWGESPPYLSIASNVDEWLRALREFVDQQEPQGGGDRLAARGHPLLTRYRHILDAQTLPARLRRGVALLEWAAERLSETDPR